MAKPETEAGKGITARMDAEARSWVVYLHSGDATAGKLSEFEAWLAADARHAEAYHHFEQLMEDVALPCGMLDFDDVAFPDMTLPPPAGAEEGAPVRPGRMRLLAGGIVSAAVAFAALVSVSLHTRAPASDAVLMAEEPVIETQIAEIRDVTLPDGTVVTLGAKSRIDYKFEDGLRKVVLRDGEAFFDVAPDKAHPFYVQAGDRLVRVVGTRFDVRQSSGSVVVSVVEGVVEVMKAQDPERTEKQHASVKKDVLTAGDKVTATIGEDHRELEAVDPAKAAAWRKGWLSYEDVSLGDIVADIHRYDERAFVFTDDNLKDLHVTAAFGADKVDQFLEALQASYPLKVDESNPSEVVLSPAG